MGTGFMMNDIVIITPTYRPDIDRFAILRDSIARFAPELPHLAIVQTEHLPLFLDRFSNESNLEIISTADVLPRTLERIRRAHGRFLWKIVERFAWRLYLDPDVARGWKVQQLTKIHALSNISQKSAVFLDCDSLFIRRTSAEDYFQDGRTIILESIAASAEEIALDIATYMLTRTPLNRIRQYMNYVHVGATFNKSTAGKLIDVLSGYNKGHFESAFLQHQLPSEFNLLGFVARNIEEYNDYFIFQGEPRKLTLDVRYKEDIDNMDICIEQEMNKKEKRYFLFQSNLEMDTERYRSQVEKLLKRTV
jgi:hypothetical protein